MSKKTQMGGIRTLKSNKAEEPRQEVIGTLDHHVQVSRISSFYWYVVCWIIFVLSIQYCDAALRCDCGGENIIDGLTARKTLNQYRLAVGSCADQYDMDDHFRFISLMDDHVRYYFILERGLFYEQDCGIETITISYHLITLGKRVSVSAICKCGYALTGPRGEIIANKEGWIKDLTTEGIEPNPGPGVIHDSVEETELQTLLRECREVEEPRHHPEGISSKVGAMLTLWPSLSMKRLMRGVPSSAMEPSFNRNRGGVSYDAKWRFCPKDALPLLPGEDFIVSKHMVPLLIEQAVPDIVVTETNDTVMYQVKALDFLERALTSPNDLTLQKELRAFFGTRDMGEARMHVQSLAEKAASGDNHIALFTAAWCVVRTGEVCQTLGIKPSVGKRNIRMSKTDWLWSGGAESDEPVMLNNPTAQEIDFWGIATARGPRVYKAQYSQMTEDGEKVWQDVYSKWTYKPSVAWRLIQSRDIKPASGWEDNPSLMRSFIFKYASQTRTMEQCFEGYLMSSLIGGAIDTRTDFCLPMPAHRSDVLQNVMEKEAVPIAFMSAVNLLPFESLVAAYTYSNSYRGALGMIFEAMISERPNHSVSPPELADALRALSGTQTALQSVGTYGISQITGLDYEVARHLGWRDMPMESLVNFASSRAPHPIEIYFHKKRLRGTRSSILFDTRKISNGEVTSFSDRYHMKELQLMKWVGFDKESWNMADFDRTWHWETSISGSIHWPLNKATWASCVINHECSLRLDAMILTNKRAPIQQQIGLAWVSRNQF